MLIGNLSFLGGDTTVIRSLPRTNIKFLKPKSNVFTLIDGGAVLITGHSNVIFENCEFTGNSALMCGGAISNQSSGKVVCRECVFTGNTAGHTGAAIDNLTRGSNLLIESCEFINNQSNIWNKLDAPHGQITVFPNTYAQIVDSSFEGGSIPVDYKDPGDVLLRNNKYVGFQDWDEQLLPQGSRRFVDLWRIFSKLYWLPMKARRDVYWRVNKR